MTSEIAVMNQRAVALAADSAVTLIAGSTVAIRNDQRKLYNLVEGQPIGLMFYGLADMMGHPWDQLIDTYQKKVKPKGVKHVTDYAASFTKMLDDVPELFPRERQAEEYRRLLASVYRYIFLLAEFMAENAEQEGEPPSDLVIMEAAIQEVWREYQFKEDGTPRPDLACFPPGFGAKVLSEHGAQIDELINYAFQQFGLSKQGLTRLREIAVFCVVKDLFLEHVTGLVFGGFGTEDRYPVVTTWFVSAIVCGIAKRTQYNLDVIDGELRSKIRFFADSEAAMGFIRGIDFNLEHRLYGGMRNRMHTLVDQVVGAFGTNAQPAAREQVRAYFQQDFVPRYFDSFRRAVLEYQQQAFINPVLQVMEIASKKELADTARELVGLNIFKKRLTAQKETVGGAVDVAVISRDGGFQWASRQNG
ncbi:MAG TPA: hypothetical protein VGG48_19675 [Rhizomicrobium sp.]|jgi:hypothetical protein